jgi:hypothetical protein
MTPEPGGRQAKITGQQARKQQEGVVVRRLTIGIGAAALGLTWYFTASAVTAAPLAFGDQATGDGHTVVGVEQLDDHVFVRTVHVEAPRPPVGGVRGTTGQQPVAAGSASSAPVAQSVAQPVPVPPPTPVATTGGSTPRK